MKSILARLKNRKILVILFHGLLLGYITYIIYAPIRHRAAISPPGSTYTYLHGIHEDYYFYLMTIRQGKDYFAEYDQYTTEPTNPTFMHVYYLLLGQLSKYTGWGVITTYYVGMLGGFLLFYIAGWKLASFFFPNVYRFVAMLLFFMASPFPDTKIHLLGREIPVGTSWWTSLDPYSRLEQVPHHIVGQAFMLWASYFFLVFLTRKKFGYAVLTAAVVTVGIFFYSVPLLLFLLSMGVLLAILYAKPMYRAVRARTLFAFFKKQEKMFIGIGLICIVAFTSILFVQRILINPGWPWSTFLNWEANWYNHKTEIYPYTIGLYLISFGILPLFIMPALLAIFRKMTYPWLFIVILFFIPIAVYEGAAKHLYLLPKIRFIHSAPYVYGGLLATYGIFTILNSLKKLNLRISTVIIALVFTGNWILGLRSYWMPEFSKYEIFYNTYLPPSYVQMLDYLNRNTEPFSNVFASYAVGVYIPGFTKNNVYVGHLVSTADFWGKYSTANSFYKYEIPEREMLAKFKNQNIRYVVGEEDGLGSHYKNILRPVFTVDNLTVYTPIYEEK